MHTTRLISTAAALLALTIGSADAQQGKAKGSDDKAKAEHAKAHPAKAQPAKAQSAKAQQAKVDARARNAAARRNDDVVRRSNDGVRRTGDPVGWEKAPPKGGTPPGLAKKGGLPPGQAKKIHRTDDGLWALRDVLRRNGYTVTRLSRSNDLRYVTYRLPDGTIRRAIIQPGTDRLQFVNVPDVVLREVLARLY